MDNSKVGELERLVNRLSTDLAENFFQTIQTLSTIINFTERFYEGSHSRFVSEKSSELARLLGLNNEQVFEIKMAGLLHDIGKVGFYDSNLFKYPHEMRPQEFKQYSLHPELGREILKSHNGFSKIADIVFQHHERLDGSGFPNNLKGNNIHPGALIIGVVDYYHNAVYKNKRDRADMEKERVINTQSYLSNTKDKHSSTLAYLQQKKGILFDKKVVDSFIAVVEMDRRKLGGKIVQRIPVNQIKTGMVFVESYYTSFGLLIAASGAEATADHVKALVRFAETGEIPHKVLVLSDPEEPKK
jgi:putative nucleotidyltransferase with HDIG domain